MEGMDVIGRVKALCAARGWTYYRLAKESGIAYSTLSTILNKVNAPSVPTLEKICEGFGISLSQFFAQEEADAALTQEQRRHLQRWDQLDEAGRRMAEGYIQALLDLQRDGEAEDQK